MATSRPVSPSSASAKSCDANHCCVASDPGHRPKISSTADRMEVARTQYEAFKLSLQDYSASEPPKHRASSLGKLARLTRCQFRELSIEIYDELMRRNEVAKGGGAPFLVAQDDFHPKRNRARQKLANLPSRRFNDLTFDVSYELGRRYTKITEPDVKKWGELPRVVDSPPPPYEPPAPQVVFEDEPARQSCLLRFVKKVGSVFGC